MKLIAFSLIFVALFAEDVFAETHPLLENINLIVGIVVSLVGAIIACLTCQSSRKKKTEVQKGILTDSDMTDSQIGDGNVQIGGDGIVGTDEIAGGDIAKDRAVIDKHIEHTEIHHHYYKKTPSEKPPEFPLPHSLHNQTTPEPNFVGRKEMLSDITEWYTNPAVRIGALIGWGGVGKSALVRKWYDSLKENNLQPDGIFWWGFYRNTYLERFLDALLEYLGQDRIDLAEIKGSWQKVEKIKELQNS